MFHFMEINQTPPFYSMLQYIRRFAIPKVMPRNCLSYLQTTLIMRLGGLAQYLCEVLSKNVNKKLNGV